MLSPELPGTNSNPNDCTAYFTDGRHLFEVAGVDRNFGLAGGTFTTLRELKTGRTGVIDEMNMLLLEAVSPEDTDV